MKLSDYKLYESKVFRDTIMDYVKVEYRPIWMLINTKEMQRLRRIKQLGGTYMVFSSAEHSRFSHSLGVYEIVRQILELETIKDHISDYDKLTVMCSALLHDVGHGPFSHSFEAVMDTNHEEMTLRIILEDTEVNKVLKSIDPSLPKDVASIIDKSHPHKMLVQMVSSQLDADRMDYLLRDSYSCGVSYGKFDMSRILRTMRFKNNQIVFKQSGVQAIEDYILARYQMYWQVYYHPTIRAFEQLLYSVMRRVKDLYNDNYHFKCELTYLKGLLENNFTLEDYLNLDETVMFYYFKRFIEEDDKILSDLSYRFINRKLFKYKNILDKDEVYKIEKISLENGYNPRYYVASDFTKNIPYKHYALKGLNEEISILKEDQTICALPEVSEIVNAIVNAKEKEDKKVFFVKEIKEACYEKENNL